MELSELVPVAEKVTALRQVRAELEEARTLVRDETDPEMRRMAEEEVREIERRLPELEHDVQRALLPNDAADEKNAILEILAGTGGDESAGHSFGQFRRLAAQNRAADGPGDRRSAFRRRSRGVRGG